MNRFEEFKKRASEAPPQEENGEQHVTIAVSSTPEPKVSPEDEKLEMPEFLKQVERIEDNVKKIRAYSEQIEKQHIASINSINEDEKAMCAQKLEGLVSGLTQTSAETRVTLRSMDAKNREVEPLASKGSGSLRMRATKTRTLVDKFTKEMKAFKKMQEKYNEKYKSQLERQIKIVNPAVTKEEVQQILENPEGARQMIFDISRKQGAQKDLQQMKDRFEDVKKIAESIMELQQMFLEMDEMITLQGDILNRIENSFNNIEDYTEDAKGDLSHAVESQKSIQKKKWIIMILVALLVIILLAVIAYILKNTGITGAMKK